MNYIFGDGFDVREDLWELKARVAAENRHRGYYSAIRLLFDLAVDGFVPGDMRNMLQVTEFDNVMLFEDSGVWLAFDVPGNGRLRTPDIMLLAAGFAPAGDDAMTDLDRYMFVAEARRRRSEGQRGKWPLVKS